MLGLHLLLLADLGRALDHDGGGVLLVTIPSVGEAESLPGGGDGQHPALGQRGAQLLDVYA